MAHLTYMPGPHDAAETVVDGITFEAFKPVELHDAHKAPLIAKLRVNPWFTAEEPDFARKEAWEALVAARKSAHDHRVEAEKLEAQLAEKK